MSTYGLQFLHTSSFSGAALTAPTSAAPASSGVGLPYPLSSAVSSSGSVRARRTLAPPSPDSAVPSLKHFVLRGQVLQMYRRMVRLCKRIPDAAMRQESLAHAKYEITAMKAAKDAPHIKALLQEGKRKIDTFETMMNLTK